LSRFKKAAYAHSLKIEENELARPGNEDPKGFFLIVYQAGHGILTMQGTEMILGGEDYSK
jgi:hypothetical protein